MLKTPIHYKIVNIPTKTSVIDIDCQKVQTLTRRGVGDAAAGLSLHFLHMSEGPFSHDAGHYVIVCFIFFNKSVMTLPKADVLYNRVYGECFYPLSDLNRISLQSSSKAFK